jgi:hypothetical protein
MKKKLIVLLLICVMSLPAFCVNGYDDYVVEEDALFEGTRSNFKIPRRKKNVNEPAPLLYLVYKFECIWVMVEVLYSMLRYLSFVSCDISIPIQSPPSPKKCTALVYDPPERTALVYVPQNDSQNESCIGGWSLSDFVLSSQIYGDWFDGKIDDIVWTPVCNIHR